jgi:hypothetical protein
MTLNSSHDNQTQPTTQLGVTKKLYRAPVLEQYGDLRDLTMGLSKPGAGDSRNPMHKKP